MKAIPRKSFLTLLGHCAMQLTARVSLAIAQKGGLRLSSLPN
jgi:hypothetical protein